MKENLKRLPFTIQYAEKRENGVVKKHSYIEVKKYNTDAYTPDAFYKPISKIALLDE